MSFQEAEAFLDSLGIDTMKKMAPSLHRIEALMEALDHPERAIPAIHVTGTNGKSSTARIITSLLTSAGLTVGTYSSPHLQSVRERISLSGEAISEEAFAEAFENLRPYIDMVEGKLGELLTYFEILTGLFFFWAAEQPVDALVVEVGLGGRWDATNVVPAAIAVLTNIGLDHSELLGEDRPTIAAEKAGIIKEGSIVVTGERDPAILQVFQAQADPLGAPISRLTREFAIEENIVALGGRYLSLRSSARTYPDVFLPLHGTYQGSNAAVALEAVTKFLPMQDLSQELVAEGFAAVSIPGRLETMKVRNHDALVVLDVAHNPDGMAALVSSLIEGFGFKRVLFVLGVLKEKDHAGMLREFARIPCRVFATQAATERSLPAEDIAAMAQAIGLEAEVFADPSEAVSVALREAGSDDLVCITGSHYVVGEARASLVSRISN